MRLRLTSRPFKSQKDSFQVGGITSMYMQYTTIFRIAYFKPSNYHLQIYS